ncbi:synaptogyrin-3-like protein [Sarcoptes scabiei]|uniref:Synaptogyrin-3-like protein n=1 Tax=Sarcoptes scabiei TaxID=52283 RepID=A0A132ABH0_SARSC|nr:synaptogyrin-3-like protein [Sarcoptes scabiei]
MNNVAFGAGKTGAAFDPVSYITRPQFCSIIVWTCISLNAWHKKGRRETCLFNNDNSACRFGSTIGFIGFIAATAFLVLEAFFQNLSSIKVRRRTVLGDIGFSGEDEILSLYLMTIIYLNSGVWSVLYLIVFGYLAISWGKSDYPYLGQGINNCRAAIVFALISIATWAGCAYLAYLRWQEGADMTQFTSGFDPSVFQNQPQPGFATGTENYSTSYPSNEQGNYSAYTSGMTEQDPSYQSNPFTSMGQQHSMDYQAPSY